MTSRTTLSRPLGLGLALLLALLGPAAASAADIQASITAPRDGAVVTGLPRVRVQGQAGGGGHRYGPPRHDLMLLLDTSGSTSDPSGADIDGNGIIGRAEKSRLFGRRRPDNSDPGDSILAAEVAASEQLLGRLAPETTRVGVIVFSGRDDGKNASLEQPLTREYDLVRATLQRVLRAGPTGGTDMSAGIRLAVRELAALQGHASEPDPDSAKVCLLLTDGVPTLPFTTAENPDPRNVEATVNAARVAAKAGITIHTFGLGEEALSAPQAATEVPRVTGGRYTAIRTPGDVVEIIQKSAVTALDIVLVRNLTTGQAATQLTVSPEGSFAGEVALAPGPNRIGVDLLSANGTKAEAAVIVHYRGSSLELELSRKNQELELRLQQLRERTRALEREAEQRAQAERQRQLDLEIRRGAPAPAEK